MGIVNHLPPGEKIKFWAPGRVCCEAEKGTESYGENYTVCITNRRLIFYTEFLEMWEGGDEQVERGWKEKVVADELKNILSVHCLKIDSKKAILTIESSAKTREYGGNPALIKEIWQELQKIIGSNAMKHDKYKKTG